MTKTYYLYVKTSRSGEIWSCLGMADDLDAARAVVLKYVKPLIKGSRCLFRWTETNEYGCGTDPKHIYGRITNYALPQFGKWTDSGEPFTTTLPSQETVKLAWDIPEEKPFEMTIDWGSKEWPNEE